ncbi:NAD(P)H-binding protein [Nevskia sp.]|uniref:NAD(P)H-binding protein n=1 Tax=Nevskia sp. TaxID=1929292 RepID=UPI0025FBB318|nr:NAD(P)H-binding protein [Nevskia sp.]
MARTALLAGATGLVGAALLERLLAAPEYTAVTVIGRRAPDIRGPKLRFLSSTLEDLDALADPLTADDLFCCLGTTTRAAGGNAGLERVDYHMVLAVARAAQAGGTQHFYGVSAAGASATSPAFYSRVKARMEKALAEVGFEAVHLFRPSLLLGARSESRPGEAFAQKLAPMLAPLCIGPLRKYRPISAAEVADAMLLVARSGAVGIVIHDLPM